MTTQEERKRKLWLFLPLLILPFLALGFYAMGGGKGDAGLQTASANTGINTELPGAQLKKGGDEDKLTLYERAQRDSAAAKPRYVSGAFAALGWDTASLHHAAPVNSAQANEVKISQKLAEINKQVNQPVTAYKPAPPDYASASQSDQLERMEKLLKQKQQGSTPDPQMQQLNSMLDKIMQIQNPSLAKAKQETGKPAVKDSAFKAIPAIIDGNQKVKPGGVVRLKLKDSIRIGNTTFPKGQSLSGSCAVMNQRLMLDIRNIRIGTSIIPVNLTVFSLDGMAGIAAPEAELGEAAGNGANGALENMQFLSMDENLSTQAATAGISAAKDLLGKKARKVRVKLKGGETVLLKINKN